jgi:flagellar basal body rod protein FlgG
MGLNHPVRFLPEDRLPVAMVERFTKFNQGSLRFTGNDLDVALNGEGFFTVQGPNGPLYTRNGTFLIDREARLVDQEGLPVLGVDGKTIQLSNEAGKVGITEQGEVIIDGESLGQLNIVRFDNQQELLRLGNSNFRHPDANFVPAQVDEPDVRQQFLEMANVNPIKTMAMLIKTNRIFELNTRAMQAYKQMDEQAAREVGKL